MADITYAVDAPFQYRFECEHCGKTTDWLDAHIPHSRTEKAGLLDNKAVILQQLKTHFWNEAYPQKIKDIEGGQYYEATNLEGKCPQCGKLQSWAAGATAPGSIMVGGMVISAIFAFLLLWVLPPSRTEFGALISVVIGVVFALGFVIFTILLIVGSVERAKIAGDVSGTTKRNKPEFKWPAPSKDA